MIKLNAKVRIHDDCYCEPQMQGAVGILVTLDVHATDEGDFYGVKFPSSVSTAITYFRADDFDVIEQGGR